MNEMTFPFNRTLFSTSTVGKLCEKESENTFTRWLCFAMIAAVDTPMMLIDKVIYGLDVENASLISRRLMQMKQEGKLIFLASHLLSNLDLYADHVLYLKDAILSIKFSNIADKYMKFILGADFAFGYLQIFEDGESPRFFEFLNSLPDSKIEIQLKDGQKLKISSLYKLQFGAQS